jgi:hypothetical protein
VLFASSVDRPVLTASRLFLAGFGAGQIALLIPLSGSEPDISDNESRVSESAKLMHNERQEPSGTAYA